MVVGVVIPCGRGYLFSWKVVGAFLVGGRVVGIVEVFGESQSFGSYEGMEFGDGEKVGVGMGFVGFVGFEGVGWVWMIERVFFVVVGEEVGGG